MPAIARTFTSAAPAARLPAVRPRSIASRTGPSRTTARTPAVQPSSALARLRQVGVQQASNRVTFAKPKPKPKSILDQLGDLVIGLPQGLIGFGKDIATDALVVPHLAYDAIRGDIGSPNDYLPAIGGMITSFKNTGYDLTHPQEFIDAYHEGRLVGKIVEDVGNAAIFAGGISKALGAGAATGVMSLEEAAAVGGKRGALRATGRSLEEAAEAGVKVPKDLSLVEAGQFGGRELAEFHLPKKGLARLAESAGNPELAGRLQNAGNVVKKVGNLGERAGNLPAAPYAYAGRGINKLAERAGLEGGVTGAVRRAATSIAPEIMFRGTAAGQTTRTAVAASERAGTRATRFALSTIEEAKRQGLTDAEGRAVGMSIDLPNLGQGVEALNPSELAEMLNTGYSGVELDQLITPEDVRLAMAYREGTLPPEKMAAMDRVRDRVIDVAQDRTQRMQGPVPEKLEPGTPAEPTVPGTVYKGGEPPGVAPGRPIVGETPRGLHPEQLGKEIRGTQVDAFQQKIQKRLNVVQRAWETKENAALRAERIEAANNAIMDTLPAPPDPRVEFNKGVAQTKSRTGDSIARRRWDQAQRQLDAAVDEYVKLSESGPSPAIEQAGREVERLTAEATRLRDMLVTSRRRVDAATALSRAGELETSQPRNTPPVAKGMVRLWRGEHVDPTQMDPTFFDEGGERAAVRKQVAGRWATVDREYAAAYPSRVDPTARKLRYVDVPQDVYDRIKGLADQPEHVRTLPGVFPEDELIIPPELMDQLQDYVERRPAELGQVVAPEIGDVPRGEAQSVRAQAKQLGEEAGYQSHGELESMTGGERPSLPAKGSAGGEYDWFYELDAPTRRRLQNEGWMPGRTRARKNPVTGKVEREAVPVVGPDIVADAINRNLGTNLSTDEAMRRWVQAVKRHWEDKSGKSQAIIEQIAQDRGIPSERVAAAVRGRIADYGALVTDHVTSTLNDLRTSFQEMTPEQVDSLNSDVEAMLADPHATTGDFGDLLESNFPNLDVTSPEGVMSMLEGMTDIRQVVDWMRQGESVIPETFRVKAVARGEAASRSLGRLEGMVTGARTQTMSAEAGLRNSEKAVATAEAAQTRSIDKAARGVERAVTAEEAARPVQGPKLADTFAPDTAAYDPYRRRTGTSKTGETTHPMSPAERARVRQGQVIERAHRLRSDANKLRKSVERYNEKIAQARGELSRSFQDRMHEDVNKPAAAQLRSAVASGGKALGNITGTGDSAAINGVIATIGDHYGMYDDLVEALDDAKQSKHQSALKEMSLDEDTMDLPYGELTDKLKPEPLTAAEVAQVVDDVLRARPDVELNVQHRTLLDDAIGRDTLLDDMNRVMQEELDGGRRLNSPYRLKDVIDAHGWNMPAESRVKIQAAWDRYQVRRANTINKIYNQWSAAVPARFRPAVQAGQRQIGALITMAETANGKIPFSGDIYLDMAESTMSTLDQLVEQGYDPVHLTGGRPAPKSSSASSAAGGGLGPVKTRGERTRRSGLRQYSLDAYARVEKAEALSWIKKQRNAHLEQQLGVRADSLPEVQQALADWAEEHGGQTMPPRTLGEVAAKAEGGGFVPIVDGTDVSPHTVLVPTRVHGVLKTVTIDNLGLKALTRSNQAFKTWVLPFSPKWHIGNVLGNVIQAWVHGGVSPLELVKQMNRIRRYEGGIVRLWQKSGLPEWTRPEIANHGLTMDEYRMANDLNDKPPRTPVGKMANLGFRLNEFVDNVTRSSVDLAALARGESSDAALQTTVRSLGDYSRMSTFERKVLRQIIPFYAWLRHSTIATLRLPISSPTRAAFLFHLSDIYRDPEHQGELFGSRIPFLGGLLNIGTISPLQEVEDMTPAGFFGHAASPTLKAISAIGFGFDLNKMAAITRPDSTSQLDAFGRPKTTSPLTRLVSDPLAGLGEIGWQLTEQGPGTIKNIRNYALGDDVRYGGTGYRVGDLQDPRRRSLATVLRALNIPSLDPLPDTRR